MLPAVISVLFLPAALAANDCFASHLYEAIALNESRRPMYAEATKGQSEAISRQLIAMEKAALLLARELDQRARPWQDAGIGVLCDEFVSMSLAPEFAVGVPAPAPFPVRGARLLGHLSRSWRSFDYAALAAEIEAQLAAIPVGSACMTRHLLESTLRAANLAPLHAAKSAEAGLPSPDELSRAFVVAQIASLPSAACMDRRVGRIHAMGVPMLCNDVPPIPPW